MHLDGIDLKKKKDGEESAEDQDSDSNETKK